MTSPTAIYPDLAGRTVFVSGGATGIGSEIVRAFCEQRADVVFVDIDVPAAESLVVELGEDLDVTPLFLECDVTDDDALRAAIGQAERLGAGVDVLVNNAANDTRFDTDVVDAAGWDASVAVNLKHQFVAAQELFRSMRRRRRGSIINFGSVAPAVMEVFTLAGFDRIMAICVDVTAARQGVSQFTDSSRD